jgi:Xaa-Pro aminopeptidase
VNPRVELLRGELDALGAGTFLITNPVDVRYLTGFSSSNAAVLVGRDRLVLATDGRYIEAASALDGLEVVQAERDIFGFLGPQLGELAEAPVAFDADIVTVAAHGLLSQNGTRLLPTTGVMSGLRAVKTDDELAAIRRAARVTTNAFEQLAQQPVVGRTEAVVAWWMEQVLHAEGADETAFRVIVAAGPNAALPHHTPGSREIARGETVLVDAGAIVDGYCSDCTRTFAVGEVSDSLRSVYEVVREAEQAGIDAVRAGVPGRDVDAAARAVITDAGYGENFGHGLGHGLGLLVHEAPALRPEWEEVLAAGNVVTVEPGIYLSGVAGVRIEDLVVVTEDRCEVLTSFPKELLTVR